MGRPSMERRIGVIKGACKGSPLSSWLLRGSSRGPQRAMGALFPPLPATDAALLLATGSTAAAWQEQRIVQLDLALADR